MSKRILIHSASLALMLYSTMPLASGPAQGISMGGILPQHVDPLDENRASAMHRGPNPHASLSPQQHMNVAARHLEAGRIPQAMAVLTQALAKYPDNAALFNMRSSIESGQHDIKNALYDMEQAVRLQPDNPLYHLARSQLYLKFERKQEALNDLDQAVKLDSKLIPARFNRGALLANLGEEKKALQDFDKIIQLQPGLPAPYFNRGAMHYALGEKDQARQDIKKFIQLSDVPSWKQSGKDLLKAWDKAEQSANKSSAPRG